MNSLGRRLLPAPEGEAEIASSTKAESRLRVLGGLSLLLTVALLLLAAGITRDSSSSPAVLVAATGVRCKPNLNPPQFCPNGALCPASGLCPSGSPSGSPSPVQPSLSPSASPSPTYPDPSQKPVASAGSPALVWQSDELPRASVGCETIQEIERRGVIDDFMSQQPEMRDILWNRSLDHPTTVDRMEKYAQALSFDMDVDTYMAKHGYVFDFATLKRKHWKKGSETLSSKTTPDFAERGGPNNGFMRVFFHDVSMKLRDFHPDYGWDEGLVASLYRGGRNMTLIHKAYDKKWTEEESPRPWVLPQMHYLGIYANDIASGTDANFAVAIGEPKVATPVDLDAVWRGDPKSGTTFLKLLPPDEAVNKMRDNHLKIR